MVKLFNEGWSRVTLAVDEIVDPESPVDTLPPCTDEYPASIGEDINLPLLVRELGERKKHKLTLRQTALLAELDKIEDELRQLDVLLDAANSL